jgi:DNA-directed RNA polymerase subunit RPC12/RpoP
MQNKKYSCVICGDSFDNEKEAIKCSNDCLFMVECYQYSHKVSFEEAKSMFLMERI